MMISSGASAISRPHAGEYFVAINRRRLPRLKIGVPGFSFLDPQFFALFFRKIFETLEQALGQSCPGVTIELQEF